MYERHSNGVRVRADGCGDAWAQAHRKLGPTFNMQDIDALFGIMAFGQNTGDRLFLEYVPDDYRNRGKAVRDFRVIAMFDRKTSRQAAFIGDGEIQVGLALYLWIARTLQAYQKTPVRFFFVIGDQTPPWRMVEVSTDTGRRFGKEVTIPDTSRSSWIKVWDEIGLSRLRTAVRRQLERDLQQEERA